LIPNLNNKTKYVVHARNLQLYLSLGLELTKVHRVLSFDQTAWLKKYIDFNTSQRAIATSDFEKDFFKLMNNAIFGKCMENVRKRCKVEVVNNEKDALRFIKKPNFKKSTTFNNNLMAIEMQKLSITFDKPIIVGFSVLDLSKTLMYDFHYNYIKKNYGEKSKLLFTDTDSLTYHIETKDIYADMNK
jgi:hypothetical protein